MERVTRQCRAGQKSQKRPMFCGGQIRTKTRPITADFSMDPKYRESCENSRLSPIMNKWPAGTLVRGK